MGADEVDRYAASVFHQRLASRNFRKQRRQMISILSRPNKIGGLAKSANSLQQHQPASSTNSAELAGLIFTFHAFMSNIFA
jgi:hypothetical protein